MRITVIGASGGIGREVVRQGVAGGHEMTAIVRESARSAAAIQEWGAGPQIVTVESLSPGAIVDAVRGRDAVVSALGPVTGFPDPNVTSNGVRAAVMAMRETGVKRIVAVSAGPLFDEGPLIYRAVVRKALWAKFGEHYEDLERMEQVLAESGLDWATVRPPKLTDRPGNGNPGLVVGGPPRGALIARADVATAILGILADHTTGPIGVGAH